MSNSNIPETLVASKGFMHFYNEQNVRPIFHDDTYYLFDKNGYYVANVEETFATVAKKYDTTVSAICEANNLRQDKINGSSTVPIGTMLIVPFGTNIDFDNIDIMQATGQYRIGEKMPNSVLVPADCQIENYDNPRIDDRDQLDGIIRYINGNKKTSNIYEMNGDLINTTYSPYGKHYLRIGDCTLPISPLSIQVSNETNNKRIPTMRSRSSLQTQSGHSSKTISVDLFFNNLEAINGTEIDGPVPKEKYYRNGLRPLIAQFLKAPFLPIENELINDSFGIYDVALQDIQIETIPGFPECIQVKLILLQFSHTAYMPDSDWFEGHFSWPIFRWYYQRTMQPSEASKGHIVLPKIEKLNNQLQFLIPDESVLKKRQDTIKTLVGKKSPNVVQSKAEELSIKYPGEADISTGLIQFANFKTAILKYGRGSYPDLYASTSANSFIFDMSKAKPAIIQSITGKNSVNDTEILKYAVAIMDIYLSTYDKYSKATYAINGLDQSTIDSCLARIAEIVTFAADTTNPLDQGYNQIKNDYLPLAQQLNLYYNGKIYSQSGQYVSPEKAKDYLNEELKEADALQTSIIIGIGAALAATLILAVALPWAIGAMGVAMAWGAYGVGVGLTGAIAGSNSFNGTKNSIEGQLFSAGPSKDLYSKAPIIGGYLTSESYKGFKSKANLGIILVSPKVRNETDIILRNINLVSNRSAEGAYIIAANNTALASISTFDKEMKASNDTYEDNINKLKYMAHMTEADIPNVPFEIDGDYWVQSIATSLHNKFAPLQVQMEESPTFQYLGGGDVVTTIQLITKSRSVVKSFEILVETMHRIARTYRIAITSGVLTIDSSFLKLFGVNSVLIENMNVVTSPKDKESFIITLNVVSFDKCQRRKEELDQFGFGDNFENLEQFNKFNNDRSTIKGEEYGNVDYKLRDAEVYPDLQLPTYAELDEALKYINIKDAYGNPFLKYPNFNGGKFLDPDFYIRQEITYRDIVESFLDQDNSNEVALIDNYGNVMIDKSPSSAEQRNGDLAKSNPNANLIMGDTAKSYLMTNLPKMHTSALIANSQRRPASQFVRKAKDIGDQRPSNKDIPEISIPANTEEITSKRIANFGVALSLKAVGDIAGKIERARVIDVKISDTVGNIPCVIYIAGERVTTKEGENKAASILFKAYCEYLMTEKTLMYSVSDLKASQMMVYMRELKTNIDGIAIDGIKNDTYKDIYAYLDKFYAINILNLDKKAENDLINGDFLVKHPVINIVNSIGGDILDKSITGSKTYLDEDQKKTLFNSIVSENVYTNGDSIAEQITQLGTIEPPTFKQIEMFADTYGASKSWNIQYFNWKTKIEKDTDKKNFFSIPDSIIAPLRGLNKDSKAGFANMSYVSAWRVRGPIKNGNENSDKWEEVELECKKLKIYTDKLPTNDTNQIWKGGYETQYIRMKYNDALGRWTPIDDTLVILDKQLVLGGYTPLSYYSNDNWKDGYSVVNKGDYVTLLEYYDKKGEKDRFKKYDDLSMVTVDITTRNFITGKTTSSKIIASSTANQESLISKDTRDNIMRFMVKVPIWKNGKPDTINMNLTIIDNNAELTKAYKAKYNLDVPPTGDYGKFLFGNLGVGGQPTHLSLTVYNALKAHASYEITHKNKGEPNKEDGYFLIIKNGAANLNPVYKRDGIHITYNEDHIQTSFLNQLSGDWTKDCNIINSMDNEYSPWLYTFHSAVDINKEGNQLTIEDLDNVFATYEKAAQAIGEKEQTSFEQVYGGRYFEDLEDPDPKRLYRSSFDSIFKYDQGSRLVRAFPAYQIFIIDEGVKTLAYRMWDNFFGYNSIVSMDIMKDRRIISDTVMMEMTNIYHNLSEYDNEISYGKGDFAWFDAFNFMEPGQFARYWASAFGGTIFGFADINMMQARQEQVQSLFLKAGARLHLRMGYGSNALNLPVLFNGTITEINTDEVITIVAQGDGIELTNKLSKGSNATTDPGCLVAPFEPREFIGDILTSKGGFFKSMINNMSGGQFFNENPLGIQHFGNPYRVETLALAQSLPFVKEINSLFDWSEQYGEAVMNVYTGGKAQSFSQWIYDGKDSEVLDSAFKTEQGSNNRWALDPEGKGMTGWRWNNGDLVPRPQFNDAPNVRIYLQDMTPSDVFQVYAACSTDYICAVRPFEFRSTLFFGKPNWGICDSYYYANYWDVGMGNVKRKKLGYERKSFTQVHTCNSYTDIIKNNIQASSQYMKTNISVTYNEKDGPKQTAAMQVDSDIDLAFQTTGTITIPIKADNGPVNIFGAYNYYNQHKYAEVAGVSQLRDWVKEMYQGELTILGDASINPYDIIYLNDTFSDMKGLFEVKRVTHHLEQGTGFITVIQPDCCCVADDAAKISQYTWWASTLDNIIAFGIGQISRKKLTDRIINMPLAYSVKRFGKQALSFLMQNIYFSQSGASSAFEKYLIRYYCDDMLKVTNDMVKSLGTIDDPAIAAAKFQEELVGKFAKDVGDTETAFLKKQDEIIKAFEDNVTSKSYNNKESAEKLFKDLEGLKTPEEKIARISEYSEGTLSGAKKQKLNILNEELRNLEMRKAMHADGLKLADKGIDIKDINAIKKIKISEVNAKRISGLFGNKVIQGAEEFFKGFMEKGKASAYIDDLIKDTKYIQEVAEVGKLGPNLSRATQLKNFYKGLGPIKKVQAGLLRGSAKISVKALKIAGETTTAAGRMITSSVAAFRTGASFNPIGLAINISIGIAVDTIFEHYARWKRHRQSVIVIPLLYRGRNFTAGLNGAKGSVVGTSMSKMDSFLMGQGYNANTTSILDGAMNIFNIVTQGETDYQHKEFADKYKKQIENMWGEIISEDVDAAEE